MMDRDWGECGGACTKGLLQLNYSTMTGKKIGKNCLYNHSVSQVAALGNLAMALAAPISHPCHRNHLSCAGEVDQNGLDLILRDIGHIYQCICMIQMADSTHSAGMKIVNQKPVCSLDH